MQIARAKGEPESGGSAGRMSRFRSVRCVGIWLAIMLPALAGCGIPTDGQRNGEAQGTAPAASPSATPTAPSSLTPTKTPRPAPIPTLESQGQTTSTALPAAELDAGTYVVYSVTQRESPSGAIVDGYYAIPAEGGVPQYLFSLQPGSSSSLSLGGRLVAYTMSKVSLGGRPVLMLLEIGTGDITEVPDSLDCGAPSWSPDGDQLALVCGRSTKNIHLMSPVDHSRVPLTTWQEDYENQLSPEWSPDGEWLAFLNYIGGQRRDPREGIYLIESGCLAEPGSCRQATHGPLDCVEWFVWSSDSKAVGCVEGPNIRFIDITTRQTWAMNFPRSVAGFAWSPSGEQLAVSLAGSSSGGYTDVFVRGAGDEALTQITHGEGDKYVRFWLVVP